MFLRCCAGSSANCSGSSRVSRMHLPFSRTWSRIVVRCSTDFDAHITASSSPVRASRAKSSITSLCKVIYSSLTAEAQRKRKGKQNWMERQEYKRIIATTVIHRSGGGKSESSRICHASPGFLCVSSAPLRLCGEKQSRGVALHAHQEGAAAAIRRKRHRIVETSVAEQPAHLCRQRLPSR